MDTINLNPNSNNNKRNNIFFDQMISDFTKRENSRSNSKDMTKPPSGAKIISIANSKSDSGSKTNDSLKDT